jgi:hypothetical protein
MHRFHFTKYFALELDILNFSNYVNLKQSRGIVSKPVSGQAGIPPYGNYLFVYSNYYFDEGSSSVDFIIDSSPVITPNPTSPVMENKLAFNSVLTFIAFIFVLALVVSAILLVYRKHRNSSISK